MGRENSAMSPHQLCRRTGRINRGSTFGRVAVQRLRLLNIPANEEEDFNVFKSLYDVMAAPNEFYTPPRSSISNGRGFTHPYLSPSGHRIRRPLSTFGYTSGRSNIKNSSPQLLNTPSAPNTPASLTLPPRDPLCSPAVFSLDPSTQPLVDPANLDTRGLSRMSHSPASRGVGGSHRRPGISGSDLLSPLPSVPNGTPNSSMLFDHLPGPLPNPFSTHDSPILHEPAASHPGYNLLPESIDHTRPDGLGASSISVTQPSQHPESHLAFVAKCTTSPLPLLAPPTLSPAELQAKLSNGDRKHHTWENWEHEIVLRNLLRPDAPTDLIRNLFYLQKADLANLGCWAKLSTDSFNQTRSAGAILSQWLALRDSFQALVGLAEDSGADLGLTKYKNPQEFVKLVIAVWQAGIGSGNNWGSVIKIKPPAVAAWTHDPVNGWLATLYRRALETNIKLPPRDALDQPGSSTPQPASVRLGWDGYAQNEYRGPRPTASAHESRVQAVPPSSTADNALPRATSTLPDQLDGTPAQPVRPMSSQVTVDLQVPTPVETNTIPEQCQCSHKLDTRNDQRLVNTAAATWAEAKARVDYYHSMALEKRTQCIKQLMVLEQHERIMRLGVAEDHIDACNSKLGGSTEAESWLVRTFFCSHPSDDFTKLLGACNNKLNAVPAPHNYDPSLDLFAGPAHPALSLFESFGERNQE